VYSWGDNRFGQLGDGTTGTIDNDPENVTNAADKLTPVKMLGGEQGESGDLTGINKIAAGGAQTIALNQYSRVFGAGLNKNGQLGTGTTAASTAQVKVSAGSQAGPRIVFTPLVVQGTIVSQTSTFIYSGDYYHRAVDICAIHYNNLTIVNNYMATYNLIGTIYISGNFTNTGAIHAGSSTVVFDGSAAQSVVSGGGAFNSIKITNNSAVGVSFTDRLSTGILTAHRRGDGVQKISFATASFEQPNVISSIFDVDGLDAGNRLELAPIGTPATWYLSAPVGSHSFLAVGYSDASAGGLQTATGSTSTGGVNTNWSIN
jgi:hypothetical protein